MENNEYEEMMYLMITLMATKVFVMGIKNNGLIAEILVECFYLIINHYSSNDVPFLYYLIILSLHYSHL